MSSRIVAGEFAERALHLALARENAAFEHVFGSIRNVEAIRRLDHPVRLALHDGRHLVFELVVEQRRCRHQRDDGLVADGDRDR